MFDIALGFQSTHLRGRGRYRQIEKEMPVKYAEKPIYVKMKSERNETEELKNQQQQQQQATPWNEPKCTFSFTSIGHNKRHRHRTYCEFGGL